MRTIEFQDGFHPRSGSAFISDFSGTRRIFHRLGDKRKRKFVSREATSTGDELPGSTLLFKERSSLPKRVDRKSEIDRGLTRIFGQINPRHPRNPRFLPLSPTSGPPSK
jgi:hypothetical protein